MYQIAVWNYLNAHAILIISNQYCNFSLSEYVLPFQKIGTHQRRCRYQLKSTALTIRILLFTFLNKIVVFSFKKEKTDDSRFFKILLTLWPELVDDHRILQECKQNFWPEFCSDHTVNQIHGANLGVKFLWQLTSAIIYINYAQLKYIFSGLKQFLMLSSILWKKKFSNHTTIQSWFAFYLVHV